MWGLIGVNECCSRSVRFVVKYLQRAETWRESCQNTEALTKQHAESILKSRAYLVRTPGFQDVERTVC